MSGAVLDAPTSPAWSEGEGGSERAAVAAGVGIDAACIAVAAVMLVLFVAGSSLAPRAPLALVFTLFVPGWTVVRALRAPCSLLTIAGSIALSVSMMMLLGEALVLWGDWRWFPLEVALLVGSIGLGALTLRRRWLSGEALPAAGGRVAARIGPAGAVAIVTVMAGVDLVAIGASWTTVSQTNLLGLLAVLSWWCWLGLALIVVGLVVGLAAGSRWAWLNVGALLFALHGLPGMIEPNPRFNVAWLHTGFAAHIAEQGTLLRALDARFSWAGFFAGSGLLQRLAGTETLLWLVRYAPVFYNAVSLVLIICLARRVRATQAQTILAATLFVLLNWIGQDYFAPQATAFVLYLTVINVVLLAFPADPRWMPRRLGVLLRPEPDEAVGLRGRPALLLLAGCYIVGLAMVVSHQLTPGFLVASLGLLAICGATRLRLLPVAIAVIFLVWLSYAAQTYWSGHLDLLTHSVGKVGTIIDANVGRRASSTQPLRKVVVNGRIALALLSWAAAGIALIVAWRKRRTPIVLLCLFVAPFPVIVLQPYGGEMALRVCYFSLPAVVLLIAKLVLPATRRVPVGRVVLLAVPLLLLVPMFVTARFGNEAFEAMSTDDVRLNRTMYDIVPDTSVVYVVSRQAPIFSERVGSVRFRNLPAGTAAQATDEIAKATTLPTGTRPAYVMLTESQAAYGIVSSGYPDGWMIDLTNELLRTGRYSVRAEFGRSVLLELTGR